VQCGDILRVYNFNKFTYTIDFPVLFLFVGVSLDVVSTFLFVVLDVGREMHPILGELITISVWFIPCYLFITNAFFVPFLSDIPRNTLSYTMGLSGFLFSSNNFSLVLFDSAFIVDKIGYTQVIIIFALFGFILFFYFIKMDQIGSKDIVNNLLELFNYVIFIGLINLLFIVYVR
jgi:hypothetical protein